MIKHSIFGIAVILFIWPFQCSINGTYAEAPTHEGHSHDDPSHRDDDESGEHRGLEGGDAKEAVGTVAHFEFGYDRLDEGFWEFGWANAKKAGVDFAIVRKATIHNKLQFYGETSLNGDQILHVVPRFPGTIQLVAKHLGESVKAGELLAKIQSNESLSSYDVKASLSGVIIEKDASRGEFVDSESPVFVIASLGTVWVNFAVFPKDLRRIQVGSPVEIQSTETETSQKGTVDYIRPTMTESTRTALARVVLINRNAQWFPGMFVRVVIRLDSETLPLTVPRESVILIANENYVFVKSTSAEGDEGFEVRPVQTGRSNSETVEILSGVRAGEEVAARRTFILKAEMGKDAAEHSH